MPKITWLNPKNDTPETSFGGVSFTANVPVDVDPDRNRDLLERARIHPHFAVEEDAEPAKGKGRKVAQEIVTAAAAEPAAVSLGDSTNASVAIPQMGDETKPSDAGSTPPPT